jgi:hypothetical protein
MLERVFTAERLNEIVNHPSIFPWIKGSHSSLDLTNFSANKNNVCLLGQHGCVIFQNHQPGIWEFHTNVLPEGRGQWMLDGAKFAFRWMFTRTDAFELLTKAPDGNIASKAGARAVGCSLVFRTRPLWPTDEGLVPVDVYSILLQHWVKQTPEMALVGEDYHNRLQAEYLRLGRKEALHEEDAVHNMYAGAAAAMIQNGQAVKAMYFYNRFARMSGYKPIGIKSLDPLVIDIGEALLRVENGDFKVIDNHTT